MPTSKLPPSHLDKRTIDKVIKMLEIRRRTRECEIERAKAVRYPKNGDRNYSAIATLKFSSRIEEIDSFLKELRFLSENIETINKNTTDIEH